MKYEAELIKEILDVRGHEKSSLHYQSECVETWIEEAHGAYPKLCDYESEWLNYISENPIGDFPYETITDVTDATVNNVVPYAYKSAILKGCTKYRDIDTGEVLDAFEDGRNLELVSVRMPVLTTTGKNVCDMVSLANKLNEIDNKIVVLNESTWEIISNASYNSNFKYSPIKFKENTSYTISFDGQTTDDSRINLANIVKIVYTDGVEYHMRNIGLNKLITSANKTIDYILFSYGVVGVKETISNLSIVEGESTIFEPFKSNILTVNDDVTLRGIGDVRDTLDCLTGEVTERIGEIVLDGSEEWNLRNQGDGTTTITFTAPILNAKSYVTIISDLFNYNQNSTNGIEGIAIGLNGVFIQIARNKLTSLDSNGVKKWLQQNPITVQYQFATESIKTVNLTITNQDGQTLSKIKPIEGTMHIATDGSPIKPTVTMEIPVEAITQNLASFIEE